MSETVSGHADLVERITAYELQVLLGTSISGCVMSLDRTFDLPGAWQRLYKFGLIDRADGIAVATEKGLALINRALSEEFNDGRFEPVATPHPGASDAPDIVEADEPWMVKSGQEPQQTHERITPGAYRVFWKSGGWSWATIGMTSNGDNWIAPANWLAPAMIRDLTQWADVERIERVPAPSVEEKLP